MELGDFYLDLSELKAAFKKHKAKRIAVQIPAGLVMHSRELSNAIETTCKAEVFMGSHPSYGACDLTDSNALKNMNVDLLINFGHAELPNIKDSFEKELGIPLLFLEMPSKLKEVKLVKEDVKKLGKTVVLASSVQYIHLLGKVKEILEENDIKVHIGEGDERIKYPGQVLGCNYSVIKGIPEKKVDSYLYVGSGRFHPLGIALSVDKPLFEFEPNLGIVINFEMRKDRFLRKRHAMIAAAQGANNFAIVVSTKPGQKRLELAIKLKALLKKKKKNSVLVLADELNPSDFDYADIDVIVSTACPRIALDDAERYKKPIITPEELEIALKEKKWKDYSPDMITG